MANRQQFSMVCVLIDHKDDVKKVQNFAVKPLDRLRLVFPVEFEHLVLTSFLWSIRVKTMENCSPIFKLHYLAF